MDVSYTLFPSYTSTVPFENDKGVYMKQDNNTYSNLLGIVSLSNSRVTVTLDSNEQTIVVADPPERKKRDPNVPELDSLLAVCSAIEYTESEGVKVYKLKFDKLAFFEYNSIDVYIDSKTNFLSRMNLYFRVEMDLNEDDRSSVKDRPRLEIVYSNIDTNPVFASGQFSESGMISIAGKKITARPAYSNYRLINNKIR
jgi:hypothetical protein